MNSVTLDWANRWPIVAILRGVTPREASPIGRSLLDSGIDAVEVPLNSPYPFDSIQKLSAALSGSAIVGAGTVLCVDDVKRAADAGAQFIVSPNTDLDVIHATLQAGLESIPGIMSPSEAFTAVRAGAKTLKVFPARALGWAYFRDLSTVLPNNVALIGVGGIDLDNIGEWRRAGAHAVGIGSALYRPGDDAADVKRKARAFVQAVEMRGGTAP